MHRIYTNKQTKQQTQTLLFSKGRDAGLYSREDDGEPMMAYIIDINELCAYACEGS
jgi:hypothetical protein